MKAQFAQRPESALTIVETLVVLAIVAVMVAMMFAALTSGKHQSMIGCLNNLKQIGVAFNTFANDNGGDWPARVPTRTHGIQELVPGVASARYFQSLADPLGQAPTVLICPMDTRKAATNFAALTNENVSYFLSLDAALDMPSAILGGDRNLETAGQAVRTGVFTLRTNTVVSWTLEMHSADAKMPCGNLLFADGHVDNFPKEALTNAVQAQGLPMNRLVVP